MGLGVMGGYRANVPSKATIERMLGSYLEHEHGKAGAKKAAGRIRKALEKWRDGEMRTEAMLEVANKELDAHGVERVGRNGIMVNMGDTYTPTVIVTTTSGGTQRAHVTDYGTLVEQGVIHDSW